MTREYGTGNADRLLRLAVSSLARRLLSRRPAAEPVVRVLRCAVRYGRDQQHVLSPARARDVRPLAAAGTGAIPVRGEGDLVSDAHEKAERHKEPNQPLVFTPAGARADAWPDAIPAPASLEDRSRSPRRVPA